MSKLTNFLIVATVMVALVGCKKDEGSASSSSSYSTDRGNLKVTLNDWQLQGSKTPHVTVTGTGDGYTIGLYNIVPCMPEVLVPGCAENNGNYTGSKVLIENYREVKLIATVSDSGMVLNVDDIHTGPFVGKKWKIASASVADSIQFEGTTYLNGKYDSIYYDGCNAPTDRWNGRDTTFLLPAINISSNFKHNKLKIKDPWEIFAYKTGKIDTLRYGYMEFGDYLSKRLQPGVRALIAGINNNSTIGNIWWYFATAECLTFSEYGRCGLQTVDFYNTRARAYLSEVGSLYDYHASDIQSNDDWVDAVSARILHDSICGFNNPASGQRLLDLINPYSQNCILTYGENMSYGVPVVEICTDWVGERLVQLSNFALQNILYSSLKIDLEHLDIPFQVIKSDESNLRLGLNQDWLKGFSADIWNTVKEWDSTKFVTEVFPGLQKDKKFKYKEVKKVIDYIEIINNLLQQGSQFEVSIDFVPYNPEDKTLMPWEEFAVNEVKLSKGEK